MKYIRFCEDEQENIMTEQEYHEYICDLQDSGFDFEGGIVKSADTIEELCDELVVHNPSNDGDFYPKHFVYQNKWETMLKPMSDYQKSKGIEIFGAIWTDKGLIYVAKMNSKGDLELL